MHTTPINSIHIIHITLNGFTASHLHHHFTPPLNPPYNNNSQTEKSQQYPHQRLLHIHLPSYRRNSQFPQTPFLQLAGLLSPPPLLRLRKRLHFQRLLLPDDSLMRSGPQLLYITKRRQAIRM